MVSYSYELGEKQSARVLAQAVRMRSPVWAEAITQATARSVTGFLSHLDSQILQLDIQGDHATAAETLPGQYYQMVINLSDSRYMTVADLLETQEAGSSQTLIFARPASLQVLQRRRLARWMPGKAQPVYISWEGPNGQMTAPSMGQLNDLSLGGLSVRLPDTADGCLFIGERVSVRFSLSTRQAEFATWATVCHKHVDADHSEVILGMQFVPEEGDKGQDFDERLRTALQQQLSVKRSV
jgi:c-di-GMP-binding flagellar brake protein YcgR